MTRDEHDEVVTLPERTRVTLDSDHAETTRTTVHCPIHGAARTAEHCRACPRFEAESAGRSPALSCHVPASKVAARGVVGELLSSRSFCLDCELPVAEGAALLERHDVAAAPVVDDHHVLVGVVSTQTLMHAELEEERQHGFRALSSPSEVEDVMVTPVTSFREDLPIAQAALLMSERGLRSVPVVDARGEVVGVLDAMDLVRYLAQLELTPR